MIGLPVIGLRCKWGHGGIPANFCQFSSPPLCSFLHLHEIYSKPSQAVLAQREITVDLVLAGPTISTLKLLFISEKLPEHQAREKVWNSATNLESSGQTDSVRLSRCLIIWGLEVCQGLSSTGLIWKEGERGRGRLTEDFRDIRGTACAGRVPQPRPSFSTPKLERWPSDNKTACGEEKKKSQTSIININQMEAFQRWHFSAGKDVVLACQGSNGGQHGLSLESNLI